MLPPATLRELADVTARGGVIGYPTETFYGLGCDPWNAEAVRRIFALKGRPETKPLPLLLPPGDPAEFGIHLTPVAVRLAERYWPGAVTLIVPAEGFPPETTAGTNTVAVRRSPHPFIQHFLLQWKKPFVTTSANLSGEPSTRTGPAVFRAFGNRLACIVDGGELPGVRGSTIIDCTGDRPVVVREGDVTVVVNG